MEIGDIVYVVWKTSLSGSCVAEVEVLGEPTKGPGWRGMVFKAKTLMKFDWKNGWQESSIPGIYRYRVKDTYLSKERALETLHPMLKAAIKSEEQYCEWAKESLAQAQNKLKHCQESLEQLKKLNLDSVFNGEIEKYVSIFTGTET